MTAATPSRWKTVIGDSLGMVLAVWALPLGIMALGVPVVLLFLGVRFVAQMIWP